MKSGIWVFLCFALALMAGVSIGPREAAACSCAEAPATAEALESATAVFAGKVVAVQAPGRFGVSSSADPVYYLFEVDRVWKGVDTTQVYVGTAGSSASCGYEGFETGREFLVFAYGPADRLETGLCERTAPLASAGTSLAELGEGTAPSRAVDLRGAGEGNGQSSLPFYGGLGVLLLLLTGLVWSLYLRMKRA